MLTKDERKTLYTKIQAVLDESEHVRELTDLFPGHVELPDARAKYRAAVDDLNTYIKTIS